MSARSRLAKHLEGWQVGAIVVFIVTVYVSVNTPRTAIPDELPPPHVGQDEVQRTRSRNDELATKATTDPLPHSVQMVGARFRALGRAQWNGDEAALARMGDQLGQAIDVALRENVDALLLLRAYQAGRFVDAYCAYLRTGHVSDDLIELGGNTLLELSDNGWLRTAADAPDRVDLVLSAFFKRRFTNTIAPGHPAFAADPVEERLLLGYMLAHPPPTRADGEGPAGKFLIDHIEDLAKLDPDYPASFARGIVLFRMREFEVAGRMFDDYLENTKNGPHRLRAANYLKASIEYSEGAP
ncbi:MAG: hypothetical protein HOW73_06920 [Polyangiaceae bacterium]|nr:hypothetical protein [Polyangiaceae bacterium]